MTTHGEDRSAEPCKGDPITATAAKMLAVALVEAVPITLPQTKARWWIGDQGGKLLISEIRRVLHNPPTIKTEAEHWSRFYKFVLQKDVVFHIPKELERQPAENWVFIPAEDPARLEDKLQTCCESFFPAFEKELTHGTFGGNKFREGKSYIIRVEQQDAGTCWDHSPIEGTEVTLAEILARELYFYFRVARLPKNVRLFAVGSWFKDDSVPAVSRTEKGLELLRFARGAARYNCFTQLEVLV